MTSMQNFLYEGHDSGCYVLEEGLGYIRLNGGVAGEYYLVLNNTSPTSTQYDALTKWLDAFYTYAIRTFEIVLRVGVQKGYSSRPRSTKDGTSVDELIKKIKRYYTTGALVEDVNQETEEDNEGNQLSAEQSVL